jgi:hypothetical protein
MEFVVEEKSERKTDANFDNDQEKDTLEGTLSEQENGGSDGALSDTRDSIIQDHEFVRSAIARPAVLTLTKDFVTVVIM